MESASPSPRLSTGGRGRGRSSSSSGSRGRGRGSGSHGRQAMASGSPAAVLNTPTSEGTVRKRGRPRKHPLPDAEVRTSEEKAKVPEATEGQSVTSDVVTSEAEIAEPPAKRKAGRPRKNQSRSPAPVATGKGSSQSDVVPKSKPKENKEDEKATLEECKNKSTSSLNQVEENRTTPVTLAPPKQSQEDNVVNALKSCNKSTDRNVFDQFQMESTLSIKEETQDAEHASATRGSDSPVVPVSSDLNTSAFVEENDSDSTGICRSSWAKRMKEAARLIQHSRRGRGRGRGRGRSKYVCLSPRVKKEQSVLPDEAIASSSIDQKLDLASGASTCEYMQPHVKPPMPEPSGTTVRRGRGRGRGRHRVIKESSAELKSLRSSSLLHSLKARRRHINATKGELPVYAQRRGFKQRPRGQPGHRGGFNARHKKREYYYSVRDNAGRFVKMKLPRSDPGAAAQTNHKEHADKLDKQSGVLSANNKTVPANVAGQVTLQGTNIPSATTAKRIGRPPRQAGSVEAGLENCVEAPKVKKRGRPRKLKKPQQHEMLIHATQSEQLLAVDEKVLSTKTESESKEPEESGSSPMEVDTLPTRKPASPEDEPGVITDSALKKESLPFTPEQPGHSDDGTEPVAALRKRGRPNKKGFVRTAARIKQVTKARQVSNIHVPPRRVKVRALRALATTSTKPRKRTDHHTASLKKAIVLSSLPTKTVKDASLPSDTANVPARRGRPPKIRQPLPIEVQKPQHCSDPVDYSVDKTVAEICQISQDLTEFSIALVRVDDILLSILPSIYSSASRKQTARKSIVVRKAKKRDNVNNVTEPGHDEGDASVTSSEVKTGAFDNSHKSPDIMRSVWPETDENTESPVLPLDTLNTSKHSGITDQSEFVEADEVPVSSVPECLKINTDLRDDEPKMGLLAASQSSPDFACDASDQGLDAELPLEAAQPVTQPTDKVGLTEDAEHEEDVTPVDGENDIKEEQVQIEYTVGAENAVIPAEIQVQIDDEYVNESELDTFKQNVDEDISGKPKEINAVIPGEIQSLGVDTFGDKWEFDASSQNVDGETAAKPIEIQSAKDSTFETKSDLVASVENMDAEIRAQIDFPSQNENECAAESNLLSSVQSDAFSRDSQIKTVTESSTNDTAETGKDEFPFQVADLNEQGGGVQSTYEMETESSVLTDDVTSEVSAECRVSLDASTTNDIAETGKDESQSQVADLNEQVCDIQNTNEIQTEGSVLTDDGTSEVSAESLISLDVTTRESLDIPSEPYNGHLCESNNSNSHVDQTLVENETLHKTCVTNLKTETICSANEPQETDIVSVTEIINENFTEIDGCVITKECALEGDGLRETHDNVDSLISKPESLTTNLSDTPDTSSVDSETGKSDTVKSPFDLDLEPSLDDNLIVQELVMDMVTEISNREDVQTQPVQNVDNVDECVKSTCKQDILEPQIEKRTCKQDTLEPQIVKSTGKQDIVKPQTVESTGEQNIVEMKSACTEGVPELSKMNYAECIYTDAEAPEMNVAEENRDKSICQESTTDDITKLNSETAYIGEENVTTLQHSTMSKGNLKGQDVFKDNDVHRNYTDLGSKDTFEETRNVDSSGHWDSGNSSALSKQEFLDKIGLTSGTSASKTAKESGLPRLRDRHRGKEVMPEVMSETKTFEKMTEINPKRVSETRTRDKYQCIQCHYSTSVKNSMVEHVYGHTVFIPFQCLICGSRFGTRSGALTHHRREHKFVNANVVKYAFIKESDYYIDNDLQSSILANAEKAGNGQGLGCASGKESVSVQAEGDASSKDSAGSSSDILSEANDSERDLGSTSSVELDSSNDKSIETPATTMAPAKGKGYRVSSPLKMKTRGKQNRFWFTYAKQSRLKKKSISESAKKKRKTNISEESKCLLYKCKPFTIPLVDILKYLGIDKILPNAASRDSSGSQEINDDSAESSATDVSAVSGSMFCDTASNSSQEYIDYDSPAALDLQSQEDMLQPLHPIAGYDTAQSTNKEEGELAARSSLLRFEENRHGIQNKTPKRTGRKSTYNQQNRVSRSQLQALNIPVASADNSSFSEINTTTRATNLTGSEIVPTGNSLMKEVAIYKPESGTMRNLGTVQLVLPPKNPAEEKHHARGKRKSKGAQGKRLYRCVLCPYTTAGKGTMIEHIYGHTVHIPFQCGLCGSRFGTKSGALSHHRREHKEYTPSIEKHELIKETDYYTEANEIANDIHPTFVGNAGSQITDASESMQDLGQGRPESIPNSLDLQRCPQPKLRSLLSENVSVKQKPRIPVLEVADPSRSYFQCRHCTFSSNDRQVIQDHVTTAHRGDQRVVCVLCGIFSKDEAGMSQHYEKAHPGENIQLVRDPDYDDVSNNTLRADPKTRQRNTYHALLSTLSCNQPGSSELDQPCPVSDDRSLMSPKGNQMVDEGEFKPSRRQEQLNENTTTTVQSAKNMEENSFYYNIKPMDDEGANVEKVTLQTSHEGDYSEDSDSGDLVIDEDPDATADREIQRERHIEGTDGVKTAGSGGDFNLKIVNVCSLAPTDFSGTSKTDKEPAADKPPSECVRNDEAAISQVTEVSKIRPQEGYKTEHGNDSLTCERCKKEFTDPELYVKHLTNEHPPIVYKCPLCPCNIFQSSKALEDHMNSMHEQHESVGAGVPPKKVRKIQPRPVISATPQQQQTEAAPQKRPSSSVIRPDYEIQKRKKKARLEGIASRLRTDGCAGRFTPDSISSAGSPSPSLSEDCPLAVASTAQTVPRAHVPSSKTNAWRVSAAHTGPPGPTVVSVAPTVHNDHKGGQAYQVIPVEPLEPGEIGRNGQRYGMIRSQLMGPPALTRHPRPPPLATPPLPAAGVPMLPNRPPPALVRPSRPAQSSFMGPRAPPPLVAVPGLNQSSGPVQPRKVGEVPPLRRAPGPIDFSKLKIKPGNSTMRQYSSEVLQKEDANGCLNLSIDKTHLGAPHSDQGLGQIDPGGPVYGYPVPRRGPPLAIVPGAGDQRPVMATRTLVPRFPELRGGHRSTMHQPMRPRQQFSNHVPLPFKCKYCHVQSFSPRYMEEHMKCHDEALCLCPYCPNPKKLPRHVIANHIRLEHPDQSVMFR